TEIYTLSLHDALPIFETWGAVEPGKGFLVGRTDFGELSISAYALVRYLNQLPANQTFIDHLGVPHVIDTRNDFHAHRIMVFLKRSEEHTSELQSLAYL